MHMSIYLRSWLPGAIVLSDGRERDPGDLIAARCKLARGAFESIEPDGLVRRLAGYAEDLGSA